MGNNYKISALDLRNATSDKTKRVWTDLKAKSLSYFCRDSQVIICSDILGGLKRIAEEQGKINARICLHNNPENSLHDMIILEYFNRKCKKPHKHLEKDESLQMLEGKMKVLIFDEQGGLIDRTLLDTKNDIIYRNGRGLYHVWLPITEFVIYRETKQGPFKQDDNIPPKWNYIQKLREYVPELNLQCENLACKNHCAFSNLESIN